MPYRVNCSKKAQMQIQQMAFVLVALVIFFGMVALLYFSISLGNLKKEAQNLQNEEAKRIVGQIASTSEFSFMPSSCPNCIDLDKVLLLKNKRSYQGFWNLDYLRIERIYPKQNPRECDLINYPNCSAITIINKEDFGSPSNAFVSVCYWASEKGGFIKCELGKIYASGKEIKT